MAKFATMANSPVPPGAALQLRGWYQNGRINAAYPLGGP